MSENKIQIGVLALQGDVREHIAMMRGLNVDCIPVRTADEISAVDGLIIPGGESTTVGKLLDRFGQMQAVRSLPGQNKPIYGTCTGMILLAKDIEDSNQHRIGLMDITIRRNAFGRQVDSFEEDLQIEGIPGGPVRAVYIRAPYVTRLGEGVQVLATTNSHPVMVRQGWLLASAFHPELTDDNRIHKYFLDMVIQAKNQS
ncbi:MAG: pyridoxal 5'-phosphate synthase glutaminase subunit PdxT [bacterium]